MLTELYTKNIEVLKNIDIVLATKIIQASQGQSFELSIVSQKHHLFNIYDSLQECMVYGDIIEELKDTLSHLNSQVNNPFVYLFGMGNGYFLPTLLENPNHKRIIIIEPELEILFVALHLYDFSYELSIGRLKLFHQKSLDFAQAVHLFSEHQAKHHAKSFSLISTAPYYENHFSDAIVKVHTLLVDALGFKISQVAQNFEIELKNLIHHRFNLKIMLESPSYGNFIQQEANHSMALILYDIPTDKELEALKVLQSHVSVISLQELLPALIDKGIVPDLLMASQYNETYYQNLTKSQSDTITLLLSSHHNHPNIEQTTLQTIFTVDERYRYFDLQEYGYTFAHHDAVLLEIASKLKHSQCFIYSNKPLSLKHAYLSHLYKHKMSLFMINDIKTPHLQANHHSFDKLSKLIKTKPPHKKVMIHKKSQVKKKARHNLKLKHLVSESYALYEELRMELQELEHLYAHYFQQDISELAQNYQSSDIKAFLKHITKIKTLLEENSMYQRFLHDFFYPSSLLYFIEIASIHTSAIHSENDQQYKTLAWAIIHYQWFKELLNNLTLMLQNLSDTEKAIA